MRWMNDIEYDAKKMLYFIVGDGYVAKEEVLHAGQHNAPVEPSNKQEAQETNGPDRTLLYCIAFIYYYYVFCTLLLSLLLYR